MTFNFLQCSAALLWSCLLFLVVNCPKNHWLKDSIKIVYKNSQTEQLYEVGKWAYYIGMRKAAPAKILSSVHYEMTTALCAFNHSMSITLSQLQSNGKPSPQTTYVSPVMSHMHHKARVRLCENHWVNTGSRISSAPLLQPMAMLVPHWPRLSSTEPFLVRGRGRTV